MIDGYADFGFREARDGEEIPTCEDYISQERESPDIEELISCKNLVQMIPKNIAIFIDNDFTYQELLAILDDLEISLKPEIK